MGKGLGVGISLESQEVAGAQGVRRSSSDPTVRAEHFMPSCP